MQSLASAKKTKSNVSVSQIFSDVARALLIEWKTQEEWRKRARAAGAVEGGSGAAADALEGEGTRGDGGDLEDGRA